jgi:hypothetical protein
VLAERGALSNFLQLLPDTVSHWVVAYEPAHHGALARALMQRLDVAAAIALGVDPPERVRAIAQELRADPACGFLEFAVVDGDLTHEGIDYRDALMGFGRWDTARVKLCFDVTDRNFAELFSEDPYAVRERCRGLLAAVESVTALEYRGAGDGVLALRCRSGSWRAHSGLESDDYVLPSGEIECVPTAVDGELVVDGWIVGTIPFGMKYGRIRPGVVRFDIRAGLIAGVGGDGRGEDRELLRDLEATLESLPGLRHVVELGIGQSRAVARAAAAHEVGCLWHERHFGLHLGLGAALVETPGEVKKSHHHLDIILASGRLTANGRSILDW